MILSKQHVSKQENTQQLLGTEANTEVHTWTMRIKEKKNLFDTRKKKLYEHIVHVPMLRW